MANRRYSDFLAAILEYHHGGDDLGLADSRRQNI
jgi:hypothetical protein